MYLVILSCQIDDLPVRIFATELEARAFIDSQPDPDQQKSPEVEHVCDVFDIDRSEAFGWSYLQFVDGKPAHREIVKWFTDKVTS